MTDKPKVSLEHYKKLIDSTIYDHEDNWGFIDYEEASDFYEDMEAFNDDIRIMIDNGQYRDAFQLSLYICQEVADIDDSTVTHFSCRCIFVRRWLISTATMTAK